MKRVTYEDLVELVAAIFRSIGYSQEASNTVAVILADADLRGVHSQGVMRIPIYVERIQSGLVSKHEAGRLIVDKDAIAVVDGLNSLGQMIALHAMRKAISKANSYGVGVVGVINSNHFGAAAWYAMQAAKQSCIGIAMSNTTPLMSAPGGAEAIVGNNPISIAVPTRTGRPWVVDIALSQTSFGRIKLAAESGERIPESWGFGPNGLPTTDPLEVLSGFLRPLGDHKGFCLAWMVDVLCGPLLAGSWGPYVKSIYKDFENPNRCGHLLIALRVEHFNDIPSFHDEIDNMVKNVHQSKIDSDTSRIYVPGEIEHDIVDINLADGIVITPSVIIKLRKIAVELGVEGVALL